MYDTGAVTHACPPDYANDYPLLPLDWSPPLRAASGTPLKLYGRRLVGYDFNGHYVHIMYYVTDVHYPIISGMRLSDLGLVGTMDPDYPHLAMPNGNYFPLIRNGTHVYLSPQRLVYYEPIASYFEAALDIHLDQTLDNDSHQWINATGTAPPVYYHTDYWDTSQPGLLIRWHRRSRRCARWPRPRC